MLARWYLRLWLVVLLVWTFGLVAPGTWFGQAATTKVGQVGLGKLLHFCVYAILAGSAGWLPLSYNWRLLDGVFLAECTWSTNRSHSIARAGTEGCVRDWFIDTAGILLGIAVTWRWWPRDQRAPTPPGSPEDSAAGTR